MKYTFNDKEKGEVEIPIERWVWGVVYEPTEDQIKEAEERRKKRNEQYKEEIKLRRQAMEQSGIEEEKIKKMEADFKGKMGLPEFPYCDELKQFAPDGTYHRVDEIDYERGVKLFSVWKEGEEGKRIDMPMERGMKVIYKYRNVNPYYLKEFVRVYMFGYKKGKQYHYHFILPDDRVVTSSTENVDLVQFNLTKPK